MNVLACLREQELTLPNLSQFFPRQRNGINANRLLVTLWLNEYIDSLYPGNVAKAEAVKTVDLAFLACLWWPDAKPTELKTLACLITWMLMWDDELDESYEKSLGSDLRAAQEFRKQSTWFVRDSLGLPERARTELPVVSNLFIQRFDPIGIAFRENYDAEHREHLMEEIEKTIQMSEVEQRIRLSGKLPTVDEYWSYRPATNLMGIVCAATELGTRTQISRDILESSLLNNFRFQVNVIVSITNDLLSLKKEVAKNEVCSLVPLVYMKTGSLQAAVDTVVDLLNEALGKMEKINSEISSSFKDCQVQDYKQSCNGFCSGFLFWSLITPRYGLSHLAKLEDGSIKLKL